MNEKDFCVVWKGTITKLWKTLDKKFAEMAWNQHTATLTRVSDKACLDACEKLVLNRRPIDKPSVQAIIALIDDEDKRALAREARPAVSPDTTGHERYMSAAQNHDYWRWMTLRMSGDKYALMALDGQRAMFQRCGMKWSAKLEADVQHWKGIIEKRMGVQAAAEKKDVVLDAEYSIVDEPALLTAGRHEPKHEKQLTAREQFRKSRQRKAEQQTLGNVLGADMRRSR